MSKIFITLCIGIVILVGVGHFLNVIYFPGDILYLFPLYISQSASVPHNTLAFDPFSQFEPWRFFARQQLTGGSFPLWNDFNAGGVPFFANSQSAVLFPLNFVYYLFPKTVSLNLIPILKMFFLAYFTYLYLRVIKIPANLSFLGSIIVAFSGFSFVWLLWPHTNVYLFLPLLLFITEKITLDKKAQHRWYVLLSLSYALAFFGGHVETLMHILILHSLYVLFLLRFNFRLILRILFFVIFGIVISSVQLLPFAEYLSLSNAFSIREFSVYSYLPPATILHNFIPFILGAPHLEYYKPISPFSNFQEAIGGYVGLGVLLFAIIGVLSVSKKNMYIKFWTFSVLFFMMLSFKIWPIGLLLHLPIISQSQNSRLIAFVGFGITVIFVHVIKDLRFKEKTINYLQKILISIFAVVVMAYFFSVILKQSLNFTHPFVPYLINHILYLLITTIFFVYLQLRKRLLNKNIYIVLSVFLVASQTIMLLYNYMPLLKQHEYYPTNDIIMHIQKSPGTILEVGNPSIPPNINLIYGIKGAESYDAIEIKNYKDAFDASFPVKNHWGKVDKVNISALHKFGINYVIADYNLNDINQIIQGKYDKIIWQAHREDALEYVFAPKYTNLTSIRFLTANYNRKNTCSLEFTIINSVSKKEIARKREECSVLLDKMFYTVEFMGVNLIPGNKYLLRVSSIDASPLNSVGFWGAGNNPYMELFFAKNSTPMYKLLSQINQAKLFSVTGSADIKIDGGYRILNEASNSHLIAVETKNNTHLDAKYTFYPGWVATVDGVPTQIINTNPFMKIPVPKGEHIVAIEYKPFSFAIGLIITLISLLVLSVYFLRQEIKLNWWGAVINSYRLGTQKLEKDRSDAFIWIASFGIVGIFLTIIANFILKPVAMPFTTTINWLSVNNHSLLTDYIRFGLMAAIIPLTVFIGWLIYIWRRKK